MEGKLPWPLPAALGHEAAAVVEAVGAHVSEFRAGDHVVSCLSQFCGACRECAASLTWLCENRRGLGQTDRPRPRMTLREKPVNPLAGRIALHQVNQGYAKMGTGEQARSVILFGEF